MCEGGWGAIWVPAAASESGREEVSTSYPVLRSATYDRGMLLRMCELLRTGSTVVLASGRGSLCCWKPFRFIGPVAKGPSFTRGAPLQLWGKNVLLETHKHDLWGPYGAGWFRAIPGPSPETLEWPW